MLEVCNSLRDSLVMKHPNPNCEPFEFNLGKVRELRCVNGKRTICGLCQTCKLTERTNRTKDWFLKSGIQSQRRFVLGLIRRFHSADLMQYVVNLLSPLLCKDFTYSRMRTNPSLDTDRATMSSDRALNCDDLEVEMAETWLWFQHSGYWSKSNFVLSLLQCCEAHLLHVVATQARTLLASERRAQIKQEGDYEADSISTSEYSYVTTQHPDLELLTTTKSDYSTVRKSPFITNSCLNLEDEIIVDESGDSDSESQLSSLDPTCMVIPTSVKAYAGVARYKDFIRCLPVHISKYILGWLDTVSLFNCVCVSRNWRILVEEVHCEYYVNQQLWEEVMLLQGAAAQGCNPIYAKDVDILVPNLVPDSFDVVKTADEEVQTTFKSEISLETAYSGYSTRKVIMEERNVYCGAYNVMVLADTTDPQRVVHTEGGKLVATGSQDRKVRLIHADTMREVDPLITGHAGSVRCVYLCEKKGFVLSGSYDTSIRCWSLETGKCQKILRGHRDTVTCVLLLGNTVMSGGKDRMCKVWNLNTGKCLRTFKHRHPISAVALGEETCISGCEAGRVKVWDLKSAQLIKRLSGHHSPVTGIKFDKWHIITCSRDGYALVWSGQGNHKRCLNALRHPKEVLCLEFMYLRVITGSADGKVRIWNMVTGQCLRIMRGNSRSDPVLSLIAIGNRVTINTTNNLLVLNFESVDYDYTLEHDKMPPLVQYGKYSDAPVRSQPYPYVRAQRMKTAGASNIKILKKDSQNEYNDVSHKAEQLPHSAKTLSRRSLHSAKVIQSYSMVDSGFASGDFNQTEYVSSHRPDITTPSMHKAPSSAKVATIVAKPPTVPSRPNTRSRPPTVKSQGQTSFTTVAQFQVGATDDDSDAQGSDSGDQRRRISWAFEHPLIPRTKEMSLPETKNLLRSQMRAKGEIVPPDYIYLTVNALQQTMKPAVTSKSTELMITQAVYAENKRRGRPSSSPARIDPQTKVSLCDIDWEFDADSKAESVINSEVESRVSKTSRSRVTKTTVAAPATTTIITGFSSAPLNTSPHISMYSKGVPSSIPRARILKPRPHTAAVIRSMSSPNLANAPLVRSQSASAALRPVTSQTVMTSRSDANPSTLAAGRRYKTHGYTTSSTETSMVPMLMYSADVTAKIQEMKARNKQMRLLSGDLQETGVGKVSPYNNPLRTHTEFKLLTHEQVEQQVEEISQKYQQQKLQREVNIEKRSRAAWLAKVKKNTKVKLT